MKINCSHTSIVDIETLIPNPKNPNKHPDNQIKLLAKIMKHQGWRSPIVVSKRSGFIVKGHGRLEAAKLNGWVKAPIDEQDYKNEADEYADMVADNKIAELSNTDLSMVNVDVMELGPDFDVDLLGIPGFLIETKLVEFPDIGDGSDSDIIERSFVLSVEQSQILDEAIEKAVSSGQLVEDGINKNLNGNRLAALARAYVSS